MLLFIGSALILSGVVFFFAYNWDAISRFQKLGIMEFAVISCALAAYFRGLSKITGQILLLCAAVLTGVLLAVYGQIYQTGADAYELYFTWAALIFGWTLISKFQPLWLVWLVVLNVGAVFYFESFNSLRYEFLHLILAFVNGLVLVIFTAFSRRGAEWLQKKWFEKILFLAVLTFLSVPTIDFIMSKKILFEVEMIATIIWCFVIIGSYLFYRYKSPDMLPIAIILVNVSVILLAIIWRLLDIKIFRYFNLGESFLFAFIIIMVSGCTTWLLRKIALQVHKNKINKEIKAKVKKISDEPVYIKIIIGAGAWFASLIVVFSFSITGLFNNGYTAIIFGVIYMSAAVIISKISKNIFSRQLSLALILLGNMIVILGAEVGFNENEIFAILVSQAVICLVFYPLFADGIYRFLAPLILGIFALFFIEEKDIVIANQLLISFEALLAGFLLLRVKRKSFFVPLGYSAMVLFFVSLLIMLIDIFHFNEPLNLSSILVSGELIVLCFYLARGRKRFLEPWLLTAAAAVILLSFSGQPGLLAAIGFLIIGYEKGDKFIMIFSTLFLICFIYLFYYDMRIDLAYKSWVLIGSGLILILTRRIAGWLPILEEKK